MTNSFGGFRNPFAEFRENPRDAIAKRLKIVVVLLATLSTAGYFGDLNRLLEITSHFKVYYLAASFVPLILLACMKRPLWALAGGVILAVNILEVGPWYIGGATNLNEPSKPPYRVAVINVLTSNNRYLDLIEQLKSLDPDILVLQEVDKVWSKEIQPLRAAFPHRKGITRSDNFGISLFSKYEMKDARIEYYQARPVPLIRSLIEFPECTVEFLAVHTLPPANSEVTRVRDNQLREIADWVRSSTYPVLVAGDLNTSMWSPVYKRFEVDARLKNARKGFGVLPTWPAMYAPFMVPIDHILCSERIETVNCWTGESFGSDHLPLIVDFIPP